MASTVSAPDTTNPLAAYQQAANKKATADEMADRFLTLLVSQMKNQDPLNPLDNAQVTSQLAQINTVQGIDQLNSTLELMMGRANAAESLSAANVVGRAVLVPGDSLQLAKGVAPAGFNLKEDADQVIVKVFDASGTLVHETALGKQDAGVHTIVWDGKTDAGATAADGNYTFKVEATVAGKKIDIEALALGRVDGVLTGQRETTFNVAGMPPVKLSQVRQIL